MAPLMMNISLQGIASSAPPSTLSMFMENRRIGLIIQILRKDGDLNKHVGKVIEGNNEKISFGGNLILELLKSNKYSLVNSTNKVKGGPFTRYNPAAPDDDKSKSCLELVIISRSLLKNVKELIIDKDFKFTPGRPISKTKMVYPDHYAILLVMKNLPLSSNKSRVCQKYQMWNINKEGGWKKYRELTENNEIPEDF